MDFVVAAAALILFSLYTIKFLQQPISLHFFSLLAFFSNTHNGIFDYTQIPRRLRAVTSRQPPLFFLAARFYALNLPSHGEAIIFTLKSHLFCCTADETEIQTLAPLT